MEEQEVKGRKVAIDIVKANIFAVVIMVVAAIVFLVPFFWIWKDKKPISELLGGFGDWGTAFILMFVGIVVHELIHGLTWACYAKSGWRSISFGVMWNLWKTEKNSSKYLVYMAKSCKFALKKVAKSCKTVSKNIAKSCNYA